MKTSRFIALRLAQAIPVLLGVSVITFVLMAATPGDPIRLLVGDRASPETVAIIRDRYGLDEPILLQYFTYLKNLVVGDLGASLGMGWVMALSTFNISAQLSAPRWVVARVLALYQMAAFGGLAIGSSLWGWVARAQGLDVALSCAGAALALSAVLGRWLPLQPSEDRDLDPLRQYREPETAVPVQPRTGPVVVTVEWIIDEDDVVPFLQAMAERRRIRRRDGAHQWALLRDLHEPTIWIERFKTATWLDYLRHSTRITRDDAAIPERLRALHRGDGPPRVHRLIERSTSRLPWTPSGPPELDEPPRDPARDL